MKVKKNALLWSGILLVGLSLALLVVSFLPGWTGNADPAIAFFSATAVLIFFMFTAPPDWDWKGWLYIPIAIFLALGIVFLMNALTNDWGAWAYAWLFCLAGAGIGVSLSARTVTRNRLLYNIGLVTSAGGVALFSLFGAIAGGTFIRIFSILLLGVIGVLLVIWTRGKIPWLVWDASQHGPVSSNEGTAAGFAPSGSQVLVEPLSKRELEVLRWIEEGLSNAEIATRLVVAHSTVKTHINNIYTKLGVQSRAQALRRARELGLLE